MRDPLAAAKQPRGVEGRDLGLSRVTVMPDAELAAHHHPGTQVAFVEQGTLTYTVNDGLVKVMRGSSDDPTLGPEDQVRAGGEDPHRSVDRGTAQRPPTGPPNRGGVPVVIVTATLLKKGFPAAILD